MNKEFVWSDDLVKEYLRLITSVEGNDYWQQEINKFKESKEVKRDWEILKGGFSPDITHTWEESCHNVGCDIWSVRRISDNTVWTVGDKFNGNAGHEVTIKGFDVVEGREPFPSRLRVLSVEYGGWDISRISKPLQRTPLFDEEKINARLDQLKEMKESFNAAREMNGKIEVALGMPFLKFKDFESYCDWTSKQKLDKQ